MWVDAAAKGEELGTRSAPYHSMGPAVAAIPKAVKLTRGIVINVMPVSRCWKPFELSARD